MAKSARRKKEDRAKTSAKRAEQARRRAKAIRAEHRAEGWRRLRDPATMPEELAGLLAEGLTDFFESVMAGKARLREDCPAAELAETARLLLDRAPQPYGDGVLGFAALAAHESGDEEAERRYTHEMLARADAADDSLQGIRTCLALAQLGHPGEAAEQVEFRLRLDPSRSGLGAVHGMFLEESQKMADQDEPERAALARFADRSALEALRAAVTSFLERTAWGDTIRKRADEELKRAVDNLGEADRSTVASLVAEIELVCPEKSADEEDVESTVPMMVFARDPQVPEHLARLATDWAAHAGYGVWQLGRHPAGKPGVSVVDLISGAQRYAEFPAEFLEDVAPWSAWLGGLVPVDGIWRCTGTGLWLSPPEADAAAEFGSELLEWCLAELDGGGTDWVPGEGGLRIGQAEPHGVYQDDMEPVGEEYAALASVLATRRIPWLAGQVLRFRSLMPALMTTEDDPMLLIEATIAVSGDLARRLRAHPSFGLQDPDDEATFTWFGGVVPGGVAGSETGEPERWTQGRLTVKDGQVQVSVNSDRRFTRIVGILDKLGVSPVVRSQTRVDPAREFGWGPPQWFTRGDAVPAPGWEKAWLATSVPALHGRTPAQAAEGDEEEAARLESILRQFEHESAHDIVAGKPGIDVDWLRSELGMATRASR